MSDEPNLPVEPEAPAPAASGRPPLSRGQKARDFMIGFLGGIALNLVLSTLIYFLQRFQDGLPDWLLSILLFVEVFAPWVLTFGLIILALVRKRNWIAFGVLGLFVIAFLMVIVLLVIFMVACLVGGGLGGL
ncbi:MAG: hypothetical protein A2W35_12045 [Chloroflexi bacterium RBG_16_57_11]|nr:MAG: hypothetical protein A2W35_12045 [Chloroflexi bacterium RBG_16_57_11]